MITQEQRQLVVDEAATWIGTKWHHMARFKGAGVDCAQLLCAVFEAVGLVPHINLGYYPMQWNLSQDRPRFLEVLEQYAEAIDEPPLPGDVAMFKFGRHAAHGSIVTAWPLIVHAYRDEGVVIYSDASKEPLAQRWAGCWRLKGLRSS